MYLSLTGPSIHGELSVRVTQICGPASGFQALRVESALHSTQAECARACALHILAIIACVLHGKPVPGVLKQGEDEATQTAAGQP